METNSNSESVKCVTECLTWRYTYKITITSPINDIRSSGQYYRLALRLAWICENKTFQFFLSYWYYVFVKKCSEMYEVKLPNNTSSAWFSISMSCSTFMSTISIKKKFAKLLKSRRRVFLQRFTAFLYVCTPVQQLSQEGREERGERNFMVRRTRPIPRDSDRAKRRPRTSRRERRCPRDWTRGPLTDVLHLLLHRAGRYDKISGRDNVRLLSASFPPPNRRSSSPPSNPERGSACPRAPRSPADFHDRCYLLRFPYRASRADSRVRRLLVCDAMTWSSVPASRWSPSRRRGMKARSLSRPLRRRQTLSESRCTSAPDGTGALLAPTPCKMAYVKGRVVASLLPPVSVAAFSFISHRATRLPESRERRK